MTGIPEIRDMLATLAGETFAEVPAGRIHKHKLDTVESFPTISVFTGTIDSEPGAMKGHRERTVDFKVEIYREATADLEAVLLGEARELEQAVETARKAGRFPASLSRIYLSAAVMSPTPDGRGQNGGVTVTFTAETTDQLT